MYSRTTKRRQANRNIVYRYRLRELLLTAFVFLMASRVSALPMLVTPLAFDFGNVPIGETAPQQTVTITNVSTTTQPVNLAGGAAGIFGGSNGCGATLAPGASCQISYAFSPTALGAATQSTSLSVNGDAHTFSFMGNAVESLLVSATSFDFGTVVVGSTASQQKVTITNVSTTTQPVNLAGGAAGAFGGSNGCGATLAPGASCQISYSFTPTALGAVTGSTNLSVNGNLHTFSFSGSGIPDITSADTLLISPRSFDFGNVPTGETAPQQTVTITNVSTTTQPVNLAGGAAGAFGGSNGCGATLAPGASCQISYAFSPTALGAATQSTSLSVNGKNVPLSFTGQGIDPLLISPLAFDFGEIALGDASPFQAVDILNVSDVIQSLSLAGGAAGAFGGSNGCGATLAPGASCQISYSFTPTALGAVTGSTNLSVNGNLHTFSFTGIGIVPQASIPEPSTFALLGIGLLGIAYRRKKRSPWL